MSWIRKRIGWDEPVKTDDLTIKPEDLDWENAEVVDVEVVHPVKIIRTTGFNIATYNLQVFSPEVDPAEETSVYRWSDTDKRVMADLPAMLELVEEQLEGLMPEGYLIRITEWNK